MILVRARKIKLDTIIIMNKQIKANLDRILKMVINKKTVQ